LVDTNESHWITYARERIIDWWRIWVIGDIR
jgi:hypothetical protein